MCLETLIGSGTVKEGNYNGLDEYYFATCSKKNMMKEECKLEIGNLPH